MSKVTIYEVEKDVPLPEPVQGAAVPIDSLEVGESIRFPIEEKNNVSSRASHLKNQKGKVFTVRKVDENSYRVWRVK